MNDPSKLTSAIRGVGVTPVTPFTDDLEDVDWVGLRSNLEFLLDAGVGLIYPAGNTGEVMSLAPDEWLRVVEMAVEVADGRAAVVPGIGHEYPIAIELARRAGQLGVDGLLAMPRTQPYVASGGMVDYWRRILDTAGVPGIVYKRGVPDSADLAQLVHDDSVVACKYAEKDISGFAATVDRDDSGVLWTCGIAERYAPYFHQAGAVGFTSGLANFAPAIPLEMHAALEAGDYELALALRSKCLEFEEIRALHGDAFNVSAVKTAMDLVGLAGGGVRPPLVDLDMESTVVVKELVTSMTGVTI